MPKQTPPIDNRASDREPVKKRTKQNRELQKRAVLEVAAQLFMEKGFAGASMSDVADALEISRTSLYYYFESKEQILRSLVEEVTVSTNDMAAAISATERPADELLIELVRRRVEFIARNAVIFRVLANSQSFLPEEHKRVNDAAKTGIFDNFQKVISKGIESGIFRKVDAGVAALTIIGMCTWVSYWFNPEKDLTVEQIGDEIAAMALESIRERSSPKLVREAQDAVSAAKDSLNRLSILLGPQ